MNSYQNISQKDIQHLRETIDFKLDAIILTPTQVNEQTTKTNERVNKIEESGAFVFWLGRNWVVVFSVVGVIGGLLALKNTVDMELIEQKFRQYFKPYELVSKYDFDLGTEDDIYALLTDEIKAVMVHIRESVGLPIIINNWKKWRAVSVQRIPE